jgi:sensor histidine kinase regulating citrate/malate metabolism
MDSGDYWKRIWFLPLFLFAIAFFSAPMTTYSGDATVLLMHLALLATTVTMCNALSDDHAVMHKQLEMAEQLSAQTEHYHSMAERVMEARKSRHDFKHHMAAIRKFIDTDDKSGLEAYWDELQIFLHRDTGIPYTGNPALDGVLYRYTALTKQEGVKLDFSGVMEPLTVPDTDLCVLLGNALDNALTAAVTSKSDPHITVTATPGAGIQSLLISNTFDGVVQEKDGQFLSRKRENSPGIGLESIRSICDKYDAIMDIRYDSSTFLLLLVLPTREKPQ